MTIDEPSKPEFDAISLIRKAQVDTILDAIQLIVRLAVDADERERKDADHMVMRLQTMLRVI